PSTSDLRLKRPRGADRASIGSVEHRGRMRIFLGVTGASGALYAAHALRALTAAGCEVGLCASEAGVQVVAHEVLELGVRPPLSAGEVMGRMVARYAEEPGTVELLDRHDLTS